MFSVLAPAGAIGASEATLLINATLLMLIVVVPVFALLFFFAWRYRAGNKKAAYVPDWEHSKMDELVWWAVPLEIVLVLGALTWTSTHQLDPRAPIDPPQGATQTLTIQVVALPWKWLFIYPAQGVASVNFVQMPVDTPVRFEVTADAPMNSFWIPKLGGQIYAMTGMTNVLNLIANEPGDFPGLSANYSGEGFSHMTFTARAGTQADFDAWVASAQQASSTTLTLETYQPLRMPTIDNPVAYYALGDPQLFRAILAQFPH